MSASATQGGHNSYNMIITDCLQDSDALSLAYRLYKPKIYLREMTCYQAGGKHLQ